MIFSINFVRTCKTFDWLREHFLRICTIAIVLLSFCSSKRSDQYSYLLVAAAFWGVQRNSLPISWKRFLWTGIPLVLFPILLWRYFPPLWNEVVYWQLGTSAHLLNLETLFRAIPGNDGRIFRVIQTPWLTSYFRWIYANGFALPVLIPIYRSFFAKDSLSMIRYSLSAHILQFIIIFPFYLTITVREVWYVLGHPDGMARQLTNSDAAVVVVNCFPSMHTSVAFAMFLLAWRERDRLFRWVWTIYCLSIIYSTLYLEIHWITVIAGILLALTAVTLGDWIISTFTVKRKSLEHSPNYQKNPKYS